MCEDYIRKHNAAGNNAIYYRLMQDSGLTLMLFASVTKSHKHNGTQPEERSAAKADSIPY